MQHGTGTWINNAESLLATGAVTTEQVIACREDVMEYLLARGVERETAVSYTHLEPVPVVTTRLFPSFAFLKACS